ncbi:MAG TPA: hypothetical protein VHY79_00220 [Rhizomicrobium sp.]|nr:hypothetical protein [Rhizomicrobium sp.]
MQPDLPWNVAGIGPEAREAARASARREGLSVGEWLTRRILRGLAENDQPVVRWWADPPRSREGATRYAEPERLAAQVPFSTQDSADLLSRISRSEGETQSSWRRIEEHLKTLARRLEQSERSQTESGRAVSQATTEMSIAAREHGQAIDHLGAHMTGLGDRLSRLEQGAATEGFKDAIKALHQGLSRLADQISETASHSASQATELATSIETVAGKLAESRGEAQENRQAVEDRIAMLAANVGSLAGKFLELREDTGHLGQALDGRVTAAERAIEHLETDRVASAALESRFAASEKAIEQLEKERVANAALAARFAASEKAIEQLEGDRVTGAALDARLTASEKAVEELMSDRAANAALDARLTASEKSIEQLRSDRAANAALESDIHQQSALLKEMADTVDMLAQRIPTIDSKLSGNIARLDTAIGGRLLSLENKLSDVTERLDESGHKQPDTAALEAGVHGMGVRLDGLEIRLRTAIAELESLARDAITKRDAPPVASPTVAEPAATPHFDLPPFAEFADAAASAAAHEPPPSHDAGPTPAAHDFTATAGAATNAFAAAPPDAPTETESFLAAARRNARAAADTEQDPRRNMFSWAEPAAAVSDADEHRRMRVLLLGGIGILIVAALVAGIVLSRTFTAPPPAPVSPQVTRSAPPKPASSVVPPQANSTQTNSAPTSPAISPSGPEPVSQSAAPAAAPPSHKTHMLPARTAAAPSRLTPPPKPQPRTAPAASTQIQPTTSPPTKLVALANSGNAKAEELLGLEYIDGDGEPVNEAEGAKWLERAASQGQAIAAYRLGTLYERGQGLPADTAKAVQWYSAAAKAGNRKAMHNLAVAYAQGTGVQKDLPAAALWFTRAAGLGLADSQFNLAVLYERGMGVPQSLTDAYKWYAIAAAQGDAESKTRLEALDSQINADDKATAQKAAEDFRPNPPNRAANSPPDTASVLGG